MVEKQGDVPGVLMYNDQLNAYKSIIDDFERLGTPDLLARNYFLTNKTRQLETLKKLLSSYLIFEQLQKDREDIESNVWSFRPEQLSIPKHLETEEKNRIIASMIPDLDQRYNPFLATVLVNRERNTVLPENVNIISWNYDSQLERAYQDFCIAGETMTEVQERLCVRPRITLAPRLHEQLVKEQSPSEVFNDSVSNVFKLNGTGVFANNTHVPLFDYKIHNLTSSWSIIREILFVRGKHSNRLHFAWEQKEDVLLARNYAAQVMERTDVVVVIGYSFPDFNRSIDKQVFDGFQGRKLYVQDPEANQIAQKIRRLNSFLENVEIEPLTYTNSFFIPNEFWE